MKILFNSLGCDKNLVDTEMMLRLLEERGHTFTDDEEEAEAVIVNTCCFIGDAKEESINTLLDFARRRKSGKIKALLACGCLAQRYSDEIQKEIPEVDAIIGTNAITEIVSALDGALLGEPKQYLRDINDAPVAGISQIVTTGGHYAYLKIAEGCDKRCTYCIIPKVRGRYRSIPMETLLAEARELAEQGVKELILVAQETTLYGVDRSGKKELPKLLEELAKIPGIFWIRILYCYPEEITEELIEVIAKEPKVCHYLDIPIQHASDNVLRRMGRKTNQATLRDMIGRLRERIPDIALRTTLISGFPGETQEDFEELYNFVDEMEFDRLGVFPYSQEEDTVAAAMEDQIPEEVKNARRDELMELQQEIAFEKAEEMIGRELVVMIEGKVADEDTYVSRTYRDAPNVDGYLFVNTTANLMTGDLVRVRVTDANEYDLIGEICHE
ncbi:MAG: 30S ribosomal protein S12 methylthiotransferase RimO [Lachnospiraceae bacterium]|nr:30S ribosomal protein S12 methylthiotransferase RimO [Lachnospiraceae bacterium]